MPVLKPDGSVRICGEYKFSFSQAAVVDQDPIPKVEDVLAEMSGGKRCSKFDLTSAYMQRVLDNPGIQKIIHQSMHIMVSITTAVYHLVCG